jgi:hypothetical protein
MEDKKKSMYEEWDSVAQLLAETEAVQCLMVPWHNKMFTVYWKELDNNEYPDLSRFIKDFDLSGDNRKEILIKMSDAVNKELVWAMIEKGQKEAPEEAKLVLMTREDYDRLAKRLRSLIIGEISGTREMIAQRF